MHTIERGLADVCAIGNASGGDENKVSEALEDVGHYAAFTVCREYVLASSTTRQIRGICSKLGEGVSWRGPALSSLRCPSNLPLARIHASSSAVYPH